MEVLFPHSQSEFCEGLPKVKGFSVVFTVYFSICTRVHARTHIHVHTRIHILIHIHMHIRARTHTHTPNFVRERKAEICEEHDKEGE